jgi:hypothetical protein
MPQHMAPMPKMQNTHMGMGLSQPSAIPHGSPGMFSGTGQSSSQSFWSLGDNSLDGLGSFGKTPPGLNFNVRSHAPRFP